MLLSVNIESLRQRFRELLKLVKKWAWEQLS